MLPEEPKKDEWISVKAAVAAEERRQRSFLNAAHVVCGSAMNREMKPKYYEGRVKEEEKERRWIHRQHAADRTLLAAFNLWGCGVAAGQERKKMGPFYCGSGRRRRQPTDDLSEDGFAKIIQLPFCWLLEGGGWWLEDGWVLVTRRSS